jgi:lipopolysaccharide transport system ATP-binding protein
MTEEVAISLRNVSKIYKRYHRPVDRLKEVLLPGKSKAEEFVALRNINLEIFKGETFGIIGRNGAGKSTLLQIIANTVGPTTGEVHVNGRVAALLELGSGFNPEFTGRENVFFNGRVLGLSQQGIAELYEKIVAFADIGEFIDRPVKTYSSGMLVRLAFAVQAHVDASIVIIDEALAVGDVFFRQKCYARLEQLRSSGTAILLVTHSMPEVEQFCERALLLEQGESSFIGSSNEAVKRYYLLHQPAKANANVSGQKSYTPPYKQLRQSQGLEDAGTEPDLWPDASVFTDASSLTQVGTGAGKCLRFAVCNNQGVSQASFYQGETAIFFYEFELLEPLEVPLTGVVLHNDRGIVVHGKGSLDHGNDVQFHLPAGTLIRCKQCIKLKLAMGEYTFELGLGSIDLESYQSRATLGPERLFGRVHRICLVPTAGMFTVTLRSRVRRNESLLTHHGIADLPGSCDFRFVLRPESTNADYYAGVTLQSPS